LVQKKWLTTKTLLLLLLDIDIDVGHLFQLIIGPDIVDANAPLLHSLSYEVTSDVNLLTALVEDRVLR
jgi:hypothetical protein